MYKKGFINFRQYKQMCIKTMFKYCNVMFQADINTLVLY